MLMAASACDQRADPCGEAAAHAQACLGESGPAGGGASCNEQEAAALSQMSCEQIQAQVASGKADSQWVCSVTGVGCAKEPVEAGRSLYGFHCKMCHGDKGWGDGWRTSSTWRAWDLTDPQTQARTDADLLRIITKGRPGTRMVPPPLIAADEAEVRQIITYLRTLRERPTTTPAPATTPNQAMLAPIGKAKFATNCEECHGAGGRGDGVLADSLGTKPWDLTDPQTQARTDEQLRLILTEGRAGTDMPSFRTLSAADRQAIIAFVRTLRPTTR